MKALLYLILLLISTNVLFSQNIKAYFTKSVDNTVSSVTDAKTSAHLDDTICALINATNVSLDIAIWDNGSTKIITALNDAFTRGVIVRYITSTNSLNSALSGLNAGIAVLKRSATLTSHTMHNKFIISDNAKVLMGSMNFGNGSMFDDYNNIVIVTNIALAQNYTIEFNEMWGSTSATPNTTLSKFGPDKTDNTTHSFNIAGSVVESYFSPSDATASKIVNAINSADYTLDIALFTFTDNNIGDAVVAAKNRGVNVRCIIENISYFGSEYNKLINAGIPVISHESIQYDFHHKYCIVDANYTSSDPLVETGSHNWSNSAEDDYDENTLIIHDYIMAQQYTEEFVKRYAELGGIVGINNLTINNQFFAVYPNPTQGLLTIANTSNEHTNASIYNTCGELIQEFFDVKKETPLRLELPKGLYLLKVGDVVQKIIVN